MSGPRTQRGPGGERGATLILVLVLVCVLGVGIAALLDAGGADLRVARSLGDASHRRLAAVGAIDTATAFLRPDRSRGREGVTCPSFTTGSTAGAVTVTCTPQAGSGTPTPGPDSPAHALFTTRGLPGYPTGTGITVRGNNPVRVNGAVVSNSSISVDSNSRLDAGVAPVTATGPCGPGPVSGTPVTCNTGQTVPDPSGTGAGEDPVAPSPWASAIQGPEAPAQAAATCNPTTRVAIMPPGSYLSLPKLLVELGTCTVVWMPPGSYYLDFGVASPTQTTWTVDGTLIGGTPSGWWSPLGPGQPTVTVPGACDRTRPGVHIVFGATSRLNVGGKADIELCGPDRGAQRVVLYGRKSTLTPAAQTLTPVRPANPPVPTGTPNSLVTPPGDVLAIDGVTNDGRVTGANAIGSVTLGGYSLAAVPYGSTITQLRVRVAHQQVSGTLATNHPRVTVSTPAGALCTNVPVTVTTTLTTTTVTCATNLLWTAPGDLTATWAFQRPNSSGPTTMRLDGVELEVTYIPPGLRAQDLGVKAVEMTVGGGNKATLRVWGSVYLPRAEVELDLKNKNEAVFARGAVLLALTVSNVPTAQTEATFGLPGGGTFTNRVVDLVARIDTTPTLRARIEFLDVPAAGTQVFARAWDALH